MLISTEGLPRQTIVFGHLLLVAVAAWLCGDLVVRLVELRWLTPMATEPPPPPTASGVMRHEQSNGYRALLDRNLFGVEVREAPPPSATPVAEVQPVKSAAELGLSLSGTVAGPPESAFAIFNKQREQELYRIGDEVSPGIVLESVGYGEVVLRRGAERLQLSIDEDQRGSAAGGIRQFGRVTPTPTPARSASTGVREVAPNSYLVDRDTVSDSLTNLSTMMKDIRVVPSFDAAKQPNGYRVASIRFGSLLDKLGVKRGDIIQTVNGLPISDPDRAYQAYQQFKEETSIQLEVLR
ncbi:MAG: type II secretion system protein GspC, partial [Nitrospirota bacterium]